MSTVGYLYTYLQSNLLEVPVYFWLIGRASFIETLKRISLCNGLTHPVVFFGIMTSSLVMRDAILVAEAFAILAETALLYALYKEQPKGRIFCAALLANLVSWQIAPILTYLLTA